MRSKGPAKKATRRRKNGESKMLASAKTYTLSEVLDLKAACRWPKVFWRSAARN